MISLYVSSSTQVSSTDNNSSQTSNKEIYNNCGYFGIFNKIKRQKKSSTQEDTQKSIDKINKEQQALNKEILDILMNTNNMPYNYMQNMDCYLSTQETYNETNNNYKSFKSDKNLPELQSVYNKELGTKLAKEAEITARNKDTRGYCAQGVRETLERIGVKTDNFRGAAYQWADYLRSNPKFQEVKVNKEDLKNLPAGCVIVYNNLESYNGTDLSKYGHILVTVGNGKEASDHVCNIGTKANEHTVFIQVKQ